MSKNLKKKTNISKTGTTPVQTKKTKISNFLIKVILFFIFIPLIKYVIILYRTCQIQS